MRLRLQPDADGPRELIHIRSAEPREAELLTGIAMRSKRSWGYDAAFMARVAADMIVTQSDLETGSGLVACINGQIAGYALLEMRAGHAWLRDLFVEPGRFRNGAGRALFEAIRLEARAAGRNIPAMEMPLS